MPTCIAAHTTLSQTYPGYVNFTRNDDNTVTVILRAEAKVREGCYVCAYAHQKGTPGRCTPGDEHCNNYCNMAPEKGKMQDSPLPCTHTDCGEVVSLTISAEAYEALKADLNAA